MFAIIETGGKQHMVRKGDRLQVAKLASRVGDEVAFNVVLYGEEKKMKVGTPYLDDIEVKGKVSGEGKDAKLIVYKYKKRKRESVKKGHRQAYTEVEITALGPKKAPTASSPAKRVAKTKTPARK